MVLRLGKRLVSQAHVLLHLDADVRQASFGAILPGASLTDAALDQTAGEQRDGQAGADAACRPRSAVGLIAAQAHVGPDGHRRRPFRLGGRDEQRVLARFLQGRGDLGASAGRRGQGALERARLGRSGREIVAQRELIAQGPAGDALEADQGGALGDLRLQELDAGVRQPRLRPHDVDAGGGALLLLVLCLRLQARRQIGVRLGCGHGLARPQRLDVGERGRRRDLLARRLFPACRKLLAGAGRLIALDRREVEDHLSEAHPGVEDVVGADQRSDRPAAQALGRQVLPEYAALRDGADHARQERGRRLQCPPSGGLVVGLRQLPDQVRRDGVLYRIADPDRRRRLGAGCGH